MCVRRVPPCDREQIRDRQCNKSSVKNGAAGENFGNLHSTFSSVPMWLVGKIRFQSFPQVYMTLNEITLVFTFTLHSPPSDRPRSQSYATNAYYESISKKNVHNCTFLDKRLGASYVTQTFLWAKRSRLDIF